MVTLLLGPALRHVSDTTALIWLQAERAGVAEVLGCSAPTFEVQGHHYALVTVTGLEPDSVTEYTVTFDGEQVWPPPDTPYPPSIIRTRGPDSQSRLRAIFGSCRYPKTDDDKIDSKLGLDALDSYAERMATQPVDAWPDALILLGDQLYADELTPETRRRLAGRRSRLKRGRRPPDEVVSFAEYERVYRHSWGDPEIRWLMSTVPTAMIFDDHDIRDDWNTSESWRADVNKMPWWRDRIQAGLASYWVYQHLGNLSPAYLGEDPDYQSLLSIDGDTWPFLKDLADRADYEVDHAKGVQFSYRWDLGRSRLIMVDSRNGRILDEGQRMMISDREFSWLEEHASEDSEDMDHLLLASSLPWLMPPVIGDLQSVNERQAEHPGWRGDLGEKIRRAADFEHWPAFFKSFQRLTALIARIADDPSGPATVSVLSGDVHHSYAARAELKAPDSDRLVRAAVYQLVCSPIHNYVPGFVKPAFRLGWSRRMAALTGRWARRHGVSKLPVTWTNTCGTLFGNTISTVEVDGRRAEVHFEQPCGQGALKEVGRVTLSDG